MENNAKERKTSEAFKPQRSAGCDLRRPSWLGPECVANAVNAVSTSALQEIDAERPALLRVKLRSVVPPRLLFWFWSQSTERQSDRYSAVCNSQLHRCCRETHKDVAWNPNNKGLPFRTTSEGTRFRT
ncbi:Uncharacterized protein DAT39_019320 [Clarias magur]|uniref:Uncharacterized protein n=1 Tax=Clarias magur TaxID=1594786 RepID=A0A8J4U4N5_CLAMG|nr:Uncharacterized protein DAT39_019320 [Clarias magur]